MTREQFDRYFIYYRPSLNRLARYLCRNTADADDIIQDTYLRARAGYTGLSREQSLRHWLRRVLCNTFYSKLRVTPAARMRRNGHQAVPFPAEPADTRYEPHRQFHLSHDVTVIRALLARIPAANRIPMMLRVCRDYSYTRIARGLGIPVGTVRSRISRGRTQFRRLLVADHCRRDSKSGADSPSIIALE